MYGRTTSDAAAPLLSAEFQTVVEAAIRRLPAEFRETFVMREIAGLDYRRIALETGVPIGTVRSRLNRAREHLHVLLAASSYKDLLPPVGVPVFAAESTEADPAASVVVSQGESGDPALEPKRRRKVAKPDPRDAEIERLKHENARLQEQLQRTLTADSAAARAPGSAAKNRE